MICVLGMHRSGTSCLTGTLQAAGLYLGKVVTQAPYNKKGNRENKKIMALNETVMRDNGGSWRSPPQDIIWSQDHRRERDEIISEYAGWPIWGFKDPRLLFTINGWLEVLPPVEYVGTFRHPLAVARSLANRPQDTGSDSDRLALWRAYNERLLALWEIHRLPILDFDLEQQDYLARLNRICKELKLDNTGEETRFFGENLRTTDPATSNPQNELPDDVQRIYHRLNQIAFT